MRALRARDGIDETARERGHAGKALEEIERDAFGGEDRPGAARHRQDRVAGLDARCRRRVRP